MVFAFEWFSSWAFLTTFVGKPLKNDFYDFLKKGEIWYQKDSATHSCSKMYFIIHMCHSSNSKLTVVDTLN